MKPTKTAVLSESRPEGAFYNVFLKIRTSHLLSENPTIVYYSLSLPYYFIRVYASFPSFVNCFSCCILQNLAIIWYLQKIHSYHSHYSRFFAISPGFLLSCKGFVIFICNYGNHPGFLQNLPGFGLSLRGILEFILQATEKSALFAKTGVSRL